MLVSWNVRGLNKAGKLREISSHLLKLQPTIVVLIETRVKQEKAQKIRDKLCLKGRYLDNYNHHENGRLWIEWNDNKVDVRYVRSTSQFIHCGVYDLAGTFKFWLTAIYAHNQLNERKKLWKDLEEIHDMQQGPWCAVGDYNNVAKSQDRVGGKLVTEAEYEDLQAMMDATGLSEMDSSGEFFTWTNKQADNPIYSRIDRILANIDWFQTHSDANLTILPPPMYLIITSFICLSLFMLEKEISSDSTTAGWMQWVSIVLWKEAGTNLLEALQCRGCGINFIGLDLIS